MILNKKFKSSCNYIFKANRNNILIFLYVNSVYLYFPQFLTDMICRKRSSNDSYILGIIIFIIFCVFIFYILNLSYAFSILDHQSHIHYLSISALPLTSILFKRCSFTFIHWWGFNPSSTYTGFFSGTNPFIFYNHIVYIIS